jgi:16S rRNA (cytosine1407-C5)-methyltransferase
LKESPDLPAEFLERLKIIYPSDYPRICDTFLHKKEHSFRINYLKTDLAALKAALGKGGIEYQELPWPKGSFILRSDLKKLQDSYIYKDGLICLQNISSMIPPILLKPERQEKILDLCAAPGIKTTQIASLAGEGIELVAVEKIKNRYYRLLANLKTQGVDFAKAYLMNGVLVKKRFPEYFDKILLDAPCSCEAGFFAGDPESFKYWKKRKIKEMASKQKRLLYAALCALRQGGELIYSTCTFSPEENEAVVDWALRKFNCLKLLPVKIPLKNTVKGLKDWQGREFSRQLRLALRILPNEPMEGFFIAKIRKAGPFPSKP